LSAARLSLSGVGKVRNLGMSTKIKGTLDAGLVLAEEVGMLNVRRGGAIAR
jgi:hypothetical protein